VRINLPKIVICFFAAIACALFLATGNSTSELSETPGRVNTAKFGADNQLHKPENIDEWILLGASAGHGYPNQSSPQFSHKHPGKIQIVQIEPEAYKYFKKHKHFADGTMLSLSFYDIQKSPSPDVNGIVQGAISGFEVHLIDKEKFTDTRAFYHFRNGELTAPMIKSGNSCVQCHNAHAQFDGTFMQFYPTGRDQILNKE